MTDEENEWAWEAKATHKQLVAKHASKFPITRKRWRLEGTRAGNSRLLMLETANLSRARYGGKVVEVIPFTPLAVRQAAKLPECPHCKAEKAKPCKSSNGKIVTPHLRRWAVEP